MIEIDALRKRSYQPEPAEVVRDWHVTTLSGRDEYICIATTPNLAQCKFCALNVTDKDLLGAASKLNAKLDLCACIRCGSLSDFWGKPHQRTDGKAIILKHIVED